MKVIIVTHRHSKEIAAFAAKTEVNEGRHRHPPSSWPPTVIMAKAMISQNILGFINNK